METSAVNNNVKVPEPNVVNSASNAVSNNEEKTTTQKRKAPKRQYNRPNVGVLSVPVISKTPLSDTFVKQKQENPQMKYKITPNNQYEKGLNPHALISIGIVAMGILSLFKKK